MSKGIIVGGILSLSVGAMAVEWTEIRGGELQGVVNAQFVPVKIDFENDLVWKSKIPGKGWSSPVMSDGLIVVTTAVGEEKVELRVVAVDAKTGKIVWDEKVFDPSEKDAGMRHRKNGLASPSALIADGIVYVHFGHMGTAALSLKDGKVQWRFQRPLLCLEGSGDGAGDETLHICCATTEIFTVRTGEFKCWLAPDLTFDRHHIGMARQHDTSAVGGTYGGQKVGLCALCVRDQRRLDIGLA